MSLPLVLALAGCGGGGGDGGGNEEVGNTETATSTGPDGGESASSTADGSSTLDGSGTATDTTNPDTTNSDTTNSGTATDTTNSDTTNSGTATDTTNSGTATDTTTATDSGSESGGPFCGDGTIDPGEECDDGTDNGPEFACLADCTLNVCGDGFVGPNEGCDDANLVDGDGCTAMCLIENLPPEIIQCGNKVYECGDTLDNDQDGLIDLDDPECISPCDDSEDSFQTNLPGQNNDCKQDCYFDANSGAGDDHCEWNLQCDPLNPGAEIGCPYDPDFAMCDLDMPAECLAFCVPLVPNGCDCFGCCQVGNEFYYLDSNPMCSLDNLEACEQCTFFEGCNNACNPEECELCFGQTPEDLPPECTEPTCPMGVTSCFDESDCAVGQFCQTGCCVAIQ